ncbi:hypothetical protein EC845_0528 [Comamonas sp. BIGb0124]|uniref:hypothetical protein n=1 Tax=Comamonas sp. BIGb0124 TaxID=2485130 RepID=UPI000F498BC9|nr:hypothetical protein [Comamonas sp. BIGb0124]ROR24503.1 hypothetical protein EC845_0528 [Comamonas sp. BIGb0124]
MEQIEHLYTVNLHDFPGIPAIQKAQAESRFGHILRKELGDNDAVVAAFKAFERAHNEVAEDLSKDDIHLAMRWARVYEKARQGGFRDLPEAQEAYFEIRIH